MHIFIDESGTFTSPPEVTSSISTLGALVIPDANMRNLERRWATLRKEFPQRDGEVKGHKLDESAISKVVKFAHDNEAILEVDVFDSAYGLEADITARKALQAQRLAHEIPAWVSAQERAFVVSLAEAVSRMPNQLFVQFTLLTGLVERTIQQSTLYYEPRRPKELGSFHWVLDAKSTTDVSPAEKWWLDTIRPFLRNRSIDAPYPLVNGFQYKYFKRFLVASIDANNEASGYGIDMDLIMSENMKFSSHNEAGLEIVDILTNAVRRAIRGRLGPTGWTPIRKLMIDRRGNYLKLHHFFGDEPRREQPPYSDVLRQFTQGGRRMLTTDGEQHADKRARMRNRHP